MNNSLNVFIDAIMPPVRITVTEWANAKRMLPDKSSIEPGRYDASRTPYMIEIMDCLSITHEANDITFKKGTQLGATEGANNFLGYIIDVAPGPALLLLPTNDLASAHSKGKLSPTIEETECLRRKVADFKSRSSSNTIITKDFPGGILFISGANSPVSLRNKSIRYLILDDYDGFPLTAGQEGDPGDLAERRTDTFSVRKKIYRNSTPTIKGLSRIDEAYQESDQRTYHVPCPFCGYMQPLVWGGLGQRRGIKFERNKQGEAVVAWYECAKCHEAIDESHKTEMLAAGKWVAKYKKREKRGYHLNSLYSPLGWVSWLQIVKEFLKAKDNPERLKVWTNTRMADVWDEEGSQPEWVLLKNRAEYYKIMSVPDPACFLTAGVDVQSNRLVCVVRGWGPGEESWLVFHGELYGDPEREKVWESLDDLINTNFMHNRGVSLNVLQTAIDAGYVSQSVYNFTRFRPLNTMATKGMSTPGKPILSKPSTVDVNYLGETIKGGVQLWPIGSDTAKTKIYNRLMLRSEGSGYYHFPIGIEDEYYLQLTAEKRVTQYRNGFPKDLWVKLRDRNDVLDCEVLALAAAYRVGMAYIDWEAIKPGIPQTEAQPTARRRRVRSKGIN
jgi:phage terminase large subunit GpA-like protein